MNQTTEIAIIGITAMLITFILGIIIMLTLNWFDSKIRRALSMATGKEVKINYDEPGWCDSCGGTEIKKSEGNKYKCPDCGAVINYSI